MDLYQTVSIIGIIILGIIMVVGIAKSRNVTAVDNKK